MSEWILINAREIQVAHGVSFADHELDSLCHVRNAEMDHANKRIAELEAELAKRDEWRAQMVEVMNRAAAHITDLQSQNNMFINSLIKALKRHGIYDPNETLRDAIDECCVARAELARVKAESVRVVKVGEPKSFYRACDDQVEYLILNGRVGRIDSMQEGIDFLGTTQYQTINDSIIVQPVRLERWEVES